MDWISILETGQETGITLLKLQDGEKLDSEEKKNEDNDNLREKIMKTKVEYIPKQFMQMFMQEDIEGDAIYWRQTDPFTLAMSFCCYYEGGQWRHITVRMDLRNNHYTFASVLYQYKDESQSWKEITKEDWHSKGFMVENDGLIQSEIIPPNDSAALEWLVKKGVLAKTSDEKQLGTGKKIAKFLSVLRIYSSMAKESEIYQSKLNEQIEFLGVMKNVSLLKDMLERNPNEKIWSQNGYAFQELYSIGMIKEESQIRPEHIKQIKRLFYGEINVSTC